MSSEVRRHIPLMVGGEALTYQTAFVFLAQAGDDHLSVPWEQRITFGKASIKRGNNKKFFFINSIKTYVGLVAKVPLSLTIRPECYEGLDGKEYVSMLPTPSLGTLFWHGPPPEAVGDRLVLHCPEDLRYQGYAFRTAILAG